RAVAGRDRVAALVVRRGRGAGGRVRLRAAGDRGVGRRRRRDDLPRARRALVRDAAADAGRGRGGGARGRGGSLRGGRRGSCARCGTATMDGGDGLLEVLDELPAPTTVLCDTRATLLEAPRAFGPQKGATPEQIEELQERFRGRPCAELPGSGAAGGLGAALAS